MRPYFDEGGITIYLGDARDVVPRLGGAWSAVLADPPYGHGWYETDQDITAFVAGLIATAPSAVFGYPKHLVRLCMLARAVPSDWATWWPTNGACRGFNLQGLRHESEHIAFFGKHRLGLIREARSESSKRLYAADYQRRDPGRDRDRIDNGDPEERRLGDVWTFPAPGLAFQAAKRQHPNQKPELLMQRLVEAVSEPGATILDPTMGSGSALVAARRLGRKAIGIELVEAHCETAAAGLSQQTLAGVV